MHATCLHCTRPLGANDVLETLPIGRRIAFDSAVGRLWVVCRHCTKWNLVPFDTRLETIDAAERLFRDTPTRFATDKIGLARLPEGLDLVRVGPALRPEFAAWRYGESYRRRRRQSFGKLAGGVVGGGGALVASTQLGLLGGPIAVGVVASVAAYAGFGLAMLGFIKPWRKLILPGTGLGRRIALPTQVLHSVTISWPDDEMVFDIPQLAAFGAQFASATPETWRHQPIRFQGPEFHAVGRRIIGMLNGYDGSQRELDQATGVLGDNAGDLREYLRNIALTKYGEGKGTRYPGDGAPPHWRDYTGPYLKPAEMPPGQRLALELWMNEDIERYWLEGELKLLEREWREADRLAAIADDLALEAAASQQVT